MSPRPLLIGLTLAALCLAGFVLSSAGGPAPTVTSADAGVAGPLTAAVAVAGTSAVAPRAPLSPFEMPDCNGGTVSDTPVRAYDTHSRTAAQKGLDFLATEAPQWQSSHACYGCHVQAVTAEAFATGLRHQYTLEPAALQAIVHGLTEIDGGSRSQGGLNYAHGDSLRAASKGFGGLAFARLDAGAADPTHGSSVGETIQEDLLATAAALLDFQGKDGALTDPESWSNPPVGTGDPVQLTAQAVATWRQAYERSADDRWLTAAAEAEDYLRGRASTLGASDSLQMLNFTMLGLAEAGATRADASLARVAELLIARQNPDGGWSLHGSETSDAYATGQSLATLRRLGWSDGDPVIAKGTAYLVEAQRPNGGWGSGGSGKAEAMWGVLGLVNVDVLTVAVEGIDDGQHVEGALELHARAADNEGRGVQSIQVRVDDVIVAGGCGDTLTATWDAAAFPHGRHAIEVVALNVEGKPATRRFVAWSGPHYATQAGSRWDDGGTLLTWRDIAPASLEHSIRASIHRPANEEGAPGELVHQRDFDGEPGPMSWWWDGQASTGTQAPGERFVLKLSVLNGAGEIVQTVERPFVHTDPNGQLARYSQIGGRISSKGAGAASANSLVELVDGLGNVVDKAWTTAEGNYRFKNIDAGEYKVRLRKTGFEEQEQAVQAAPAGSASADLEY